jgi:hypothetical membrane protein
MTASRPTVVSFSLTNRGLGTLGLVSVGIILAGMIVTALPYNGFDGETYSPLNHFVSELGEIGASHLAWVFNLGIILGGVGLGTFLVLVSRRLDGRFRNVMLVVALVAGAGGVSVGIYPMDYPTVHLIASLTFFLSGWIAAAVFGLWQIRRPRPGYTRLLILPAALNVAVSWVFIVVYAGWRPGGGDGRIVDRAAFWSVAALEWASLLTLLLWLACLAIVVRRLPSEE